MKKCLLRVEEDPIILAEVENFRAECNRLDEKAKFIFKQMEDLKEAMIKKRLDQWSVIENRLKEISLFPSDFDKEIHMLCIEGNALFFLKQKDHNKEVLSELLRSMIPSAKD